MTAWRALHRHGYLTSYNFNAMYYTLVDIPKFDEHGLWSFRNIRFSRYGSLTNTAVALVTQSKAGYQARELSELMGVWVAPLLSRLYEQRRVDRVKVGPVFVYVAQDPRVREKQIRNRRSELERVQERLTLPEPERIIAVLVELIRRPDVQPESLRRRLARRGVRITPQELKAIFAHYKLDTRKKGRLSS
ncbi:MAG: hypothetical protein DRO11_07570 [Methanobacteriota archaeon]|nr:MAG: hypothetical protein DRO11_07570 [Euryarchaeota archaeon]